MFVRDGARKNLLAGERELFIEEQWPNVIATIRLLGLDLSDLMATAREILDQPPKEDDQ
jgi:GntR family transcriptional regulator